MCASKAEVGQLVELEDAMSCWKSSDFLSNDCTDHVESEADVLCDGLEESMTESVPPTLPGESKVPMTAFNKLVHPKSWFAEFTTDSPMIDADDSLTAFMN